MIELTRDIVSAYVLNNRVPVAELPGLIASVHAVLSGFGKLRPRRRRITRSLRRKSGSQSTGPHHQFPRRQAVQNPEAAPYHAWLHAGRVRKEFGLGHDYRWYPPDTPPIALNSPRAWGSARSGASNGRAQDQGRSEADRPSGPSWAAEEGRCHRRRVIRILRTHGGCRAPDAPCHLVMPSDPGGQRDRARRYLLHC